MGKKEFGEYLETIRWSGSGLGLVECNKYDLSPLRPGRRHLSRHKIARLAFYEIEFFIRIKT